jgi:hypothetical protein
MVSNIEPSLPPPRQTCWELVGDVLLFHPLPQLDSGPTNFIHFVLIGLWLEIKKGSRKDLNGVLSLRKLHINGQRWQYEELSWG